MAVPSQKVLDEIKAKISEQVMHRREIEPDNFDFHELTQDITRSITDQLYRFYQPQLAEKYKKKVEAGENDNFSNDLVVEEIVKKIHEKLPAAVSDKVALSIVDRVVNELEEQYQPKENTLDHRRDIWLRAIRHFITPAYFVIALVLFFLSFFVAFEAAEIVIQTSKLLKWTFWADDWKQLISQSDQNFGTRFYLNQIVATVLSILDILLLAALVIMVMIGGFENSVGRIGKAHNVPTWFGKLGITELKLKVAGSIVIISSIHLLTFFMLLDVTNRQSRSKSIEVMIDSDLKQATLVAYQKFESMFSTSSYDYEALKWTAIVHVVFVVSAAILAWMSTLKVENH